MRFSHETTRVQVDHSKRVISFRSLAGDYISIISTELKYFDVETQTLQYPYHVYERRICEKIEELED
jgi:hypothetical protein